MREISPQENLNNLYSLRGAKVLGDYLKANEGVVGGNHEDANEEIVSLLQDLILDLHHAFPAQDILEITQTASIIYKNELVDAVLQRRNADG